MEGTREGGRGNGGDGVKEGKREGGRDWRAWREGGRERMDDRWVMGEGKGEESGKG